MELLRRALLIGCLLSGLWLVRLAPLDPLVTITPIDFALQQRQEAASLPDSQKTEAQRRRAALPLSVYIEEFLQFNVFSATGPEWERFLAEIDRRVKPGSAQAVFMPPDAEPIRAVADKLASGRGTTYVSLSRPGGDAHYRVDQHRWDRHAFRVGKGFTGTPAPPASLFYPFRGVGLVCMLTGAMLFTLLPSRPPHARNISVKEGLGLILGAVSFAVPLFAVGGSVQALTRAPLLTALCWMITAIGMHVFAAPLRTAPDPLITADAPAGARVVANTLFVREGLGLMLMAFGPLAFLIWATMILWNR